MGRADLKAIVDTPEFQRAFRRYAKGSVEGRVLKGLERLALGTTKESERAHARNLTASANALRQSQKETGDGVPERIPV